MTEMKHSLSVMAKKFEERFRGFGYKGGFPLIKVKISHSPFSSSTLAISEKMR